jgi:hypothetical protein
MRTRTRAAGLGSALAIALSAIAATAGAQPKKPPATVNVGECVRYRQDQDDGGIGFTLRSSCSADLDCSISWNLRCDGDPAGGKRQGAQTFFLAAGSTGAAYASADACGDKGWSISQVRWSCRGSE